MEEKNKLIEEWTQITDKLNEKLEELENLDMEREKLATKVGKISDENLKEMMSVSLESYKLLLDEVRTLRKQSEALRKKIEG